MRVWRDLRAAMSQMLAFFVLGVSVDLSCALVPFLRVGSCDGCGSVAAGLLDSNANSMAAFFGGEATPSSLEERFPSALVVADCWMWTLPSVCHAHNSMTAGAAGWMEDVLAHRVSEAALPQLGSSSSFVWFPGVLAMTLEAVSVCAEANVSEGGSLMRASCAAMLSCAFSILREGLEPAHRVRGLALPAAMRLSRWKLLYSGMVERSFVCIFANSDVFPDVCAGSLACGPGSKEKSQSKDVFQLTWGFIKSPSQVGMYVAAAALLTPFMTYGYAAALSETLMHFESHCAVAAAASATKGVYDVFLTLFFGWSGILAQPFAYPMVLGGVFLHLFVLGCMLLRTYLKPADQVYKGTVEATGFMGTTTSGQVDLWGGNSRPSSEVTAWCSSCIWIVSPG